MRGIRHVRCHSLSHRGVTVAIYERLLGGATVGYRWKAISRGVSTLAEGICGSLSEAIHTGKEVIDTMAGMDNDPT